MDDDREIRNLLASETKDPDLRRRIFALLERDPATLTPQDQELVDHTVGGILNAETKRLRYEIERLRGPPWWLPGLFRTRRSPSDPDIAKRIRGPRRPTRSAAADRDNDVPVHGYLAILRWIAPVLLIACLGMRAVGARGMSLPWTLSLWVILLVAVGPLVSLPSEFGSAHRAGGGPWAGRCSGGSPCLR